MATVSVSARIDDEDGHLLNRLAEATDRQPSYHIKRAIHEYVRRELWQVSEIQKGIEQAERGEFAPKEKVDALFAEARSRRHGA